MTPHERPAATGGRREARRLAAGIIAAGLLLTGTAAWTAARVDANTEQRLLESQTRQAASILTSAVQLIERPLGTALSVQRVAAPSDRTKAFRRFMVSFVGPGKMFVGASLWQRRGDTVEPIASTGEAPAVSLDDPATRSYVLRAFEHTTPTVEQLRIGDRARIAWAQADPLTGYAVYAERAIPADRRAPVDTNSAYADLHYAIYLGRDVTPDALTTTDVPPTTLPLDGDTARDEIRFGDTVLTLVTAPRVHLGSSLSRWLPTWLLVGGLLATLVAAGTAHRLARARRDAEDDATTITELYQQVDALYGQQRDLFERLQRALLPSAMPTLPQAEFASRYVAGARGIDIGGDWYSVVALDEHRFGFVVGDVSGRGVDTVAVMAQARFTVRAYLLDGHGPAAVLERCSHQFDIEADGHLTTVLVGVGDARTGELILANAGHPAPMLVNGVVEPVSVPPGRPLGIGPATYAETTVRVPAGATLFCFTDGLVERRGEDIDAGTARLAATLRTAAAKSPEEMVAHAVASLRRADTADDIAALALRWTGAY